MSAADDSAQEVEALTASRSPSSKAMTPPPAALHLNLNAATAGEDYAAERGSSEANPETVESGSSSTPRPSSSPLLSTSAAAAPHSEASPSTQPDEDNKGSDDSQGLDAVLEADTSYVPLPPEQPNGNSVRRKRAVSVSDPSGEASAFVHWLQALPDEAVSEELGTSENNLGRDLGASQLKILSSVASLSDLIDGTVFASLLSFIDQDYFSHPYPAATSHDGRTEQDSSMEETLRRQAGLKRIHKQVLAYLDAEEHLDTNLDDEGHAPEALALDTDLLVHSSSSTLTAAAIESEVLKLVRLVLLVAVRSKRQGMFISAIQSRLDPADQQGLMDAISSVQSNFAIRGDTLQDPDHDATTETDTEAGTETDTSDAEREDEQDSLAAADNQNHDTATTDVHAASSHTSTSSSHDLHSVPASSSATQVPAPGDKEVRSPRSDDENRTLVGSNLGLTPLPGSATGLANGSSTVTANSDEEPELDSDDILQATTIGFGLFGAGSETPEARGTAVAERLVRKGSTTALIKAFSRLRGLYETQTSHTESLESSLPALQERVEAQEEELTAFRAGVGKRDVDTETLQTQQQELERLTDEVRQMEDALAAAEASMDNMRPLADVGQKLPAQLAERDAKIASLVDQLDEARHASDALTRAQSQIEKYQRKLAEVQDAKRQLRSLETENAVLIQRNEAMADEAERAGPVRGLVDKYKAQVKQLQLELTQTTSRLHDLQSQHDAAQARLVTSNERIKADQEELELYQERVRELELGTGTRDHVRRTSTLSSTDPAGDESFISDAATSEAGGSGGLGEELEDAMAPKSRTELRLEVRRLTRERDAAVANKADASRILILENLLEDTNGLKDKYEKDYLSEHQEHLLLQRQLEDIASGKSDKGDSAEANLALRTRLNQVVEELDNTKKSLVNLQLQFDAQLKELTVAKSDLALVHHDQLDILHKLRASVESEKESLTGEVVQLKRDLSESEKRGGLLMERVNQLLMDKVGLQETSLEERTTQLENERRFGEMKRNLAAKGWPNEATEAVAVAHQAKDMLELQLKSVTEKREKARQFIRKQDKLIKELRATSSKGSADPADVARLKAHVKRVEESLSSVRKQLTEQLYSGTHPAAFGRPPPIIGPSSSWLASQRRLAQPSQPIGSIAPPSLSLSSPHRG